MAPSVNGEPAMDANDWKNHLPYDSRQKIVNKIMATLMKHLPYSGQAGINELKRIAARFEDKIFSGAVNQNDYLRKISMKMLTMETKYQNAAGSSYPIPADSNNVAFDELDNLMINNGNVVEPCLPNVEPALNSGDWRTQLPPGSRQNIVNKIMDTLTRRFPYSGPEGINELKKIATRFEEKVFSGAVNQTDYCRKISMKMLTIPPVPASSNAADSINLTLDELGSHMFNDNSEPCLPNEQEPAVNSGDWRIQLPPDSRQNIVNKIMDTLTRHLPYSGPEGINELKKIATRFEEKVFSGAVNQTDYFRKISMKMLTIPPVPASSIPAASNNLALDELGNLMFNDNSEPSLPKEEPAVNSGDWRIQLPPDSRHKHVDKLMETLKKHVPYSGQEGIEELRRIAISFEELIFNTALNQVDYFRKIFLKMQTMEEDD